MKPALAYKSLAHTGSKFRLLLFIIFLVQLFYFSSINLKIPLPARALEVWANSFLPQDTEVRFIRPHIIGFSKLEMGGLVLQSKGKVILEFEDLSLTLKPIWPIRNHISLLKHVKMSKLLILPEIDGVNKFELSKLSLHHGAQNDSLFLKTNINLGHVYSKFNFEIQSINQVLQNHWDQKNSKDFQLSEALEAIVLIKQNIFQIIEKIPKLNTHITGKFNESVGEIFISQKQLPGNEKKSSKNLTSKLSWDTNDKDLAKFKFELLAEEFALFTKPLQFHFLKPKFIGGGILNLEDFTLTSADAYLNYERLSASGKILGEIPTINLSLHKRNKKLSAYLFSDTNATDISVSMQNDEKEWFAHGSIVLIPKNINLHAVLPQGDLRIINGEKFHLRLLKNLVPIRKSSPLQFTLSASNFSALQAPVGEFRLSGEILPTLSVFIDEAEGELGKSKVNGTYYQKWNPAEYRFLINGSCHPPDINNWLGLWWHPIWNNFVFTEEIPVGNFSISGIWSHPPRNSVTVGQVKFESLIYKGLTLGSATVNVEVDDHSTRLIGKNIRHAHGSANGTLSFPRALINSNVQAEYSFEGTFPVNEAKSVLGDDVEEILEDLNVTSVRSEARGQIISSNLEESSDDNHSWFDLHVSTNEPFTYDGIDIDYAHGEISKSNGITQMKFDNLGLADGKAKLTVKQLSSKSDQISLSIDLKNAQRQKLINNFSKSSTWGEQKKEQGVDLIKNNFADETNYDGKIDFSLQAEGPRSDIKYFVGTGSFMLHDVDIGSIHLLGGIRSKLGAFNIPLPSDALNFNKLEIPFALEHDRLLFDNASLQGPLSKLEASGEVHWITQEVDLLADFKLAGNLNIPVLKQIVNFADPLSRISKLRIQGNWENPDWSIHLNANPLKK